MAGVDRASVVGDTRLRWNSESMANPDDGLLRGAFWPFRVGPFPLAPFPCPFPTLWPLRKTLGIGQRLLPHHNQCGLGPIGFSREGDLSRIYDGSFFIEWMGETCSLRLTG